MRGLLQTLWNGPPMQGPIPHPVPDQENLPSYHYKAVFDTPSKAEDGNSRNVDDYQPRANIRSLFATGKLAEDPAWSIGFSSKFIVEDRLWFVKGEPSTTSEHGTTRASTHVII